MNTYKIYVSRGLVVNKKVLAKIGYKQELNMADGFSSTLNRDNQIVKKSVGLIDILHLNANNLPYKFVDKKVVPKLYEEILGSISHVESRMSMLGFKPELLEDLYDLAEDIFTKYNARLTEHFYLKEVPNINPHLNDGIKMSDVTLKPIIRKL